MASKHGCFFRILIGFLVLLIVLIVLIVALFFQMIDKPVSYPAPTFDKHDTGVMAGVITRLARSLVDKEGRVVDTAELHLTQKEVQTILNAMLRDDSEDAPETVPYAVTWEDGRIRAFLSAQSESGDKAINLFIELAPYVDDGQLTIVPGSGSIGKLSMPRFALDKAAQWIEKAAMDREKIRTTLSAFTRIEPGEDGTLILMFDPRDVNTVVRILRSAGQDPSEAEADEDDGEEEDDESEESDSGEEDREDDGEDDGEEKTEDYL